MSMLETVRRLSTATSGLHRSMKDTADAVGAFLVDVFHYLAVFAIGATTVWSAAAAFSGMTARGRASLADILLLLIYLIYEVERWSSFISRPRTFPCGT